MSARAEQTLSSANHPFHRNVIEVIAEYDFPVGEKTWLVPNVAIEANAIDTPVVPGREVTRITLSVANAICGSSEPLSTAELEYLCDLTCVRYADVAQLLDVTRATVSIWFKKARPVSRTYSVKLKKWFWQKIFAKRLEKPLLFAVEEAFDDAILLQRLNREAIEQGLASPVTLAPAGAALAPTGVAPAPAGVAPAPASQE